MWGCCRCCCVRSQPASQPASCCLGTLRGIRQPQPNGTYSKDDDFRRFIYVLPPPSPCNGFRRRFDVSVRFQLVAFAGRLAVIWGDWSYRQRRRDLAETLPSKLVVLTILSSTSTTGSALPSFGRVPTGLIHGYQTRGKRSAHFALAWVFFFFWKKSVSLTVLP